MSAGSILNLEVGTEYECRFVFSDPDRVKGEAKKMVTARTREEPQPAQGGREYHVYPFGYQGARQEPAFTGLLAAYYMGAEISAHSRGRLDLPKHLCGPRHDDPPAPNLHFLNNLFVGDNRPVPILSVRTFTNYSTSDDNGFRPNANYGEATGQDHHSKLVDYDIFVSVALPDAADPQRLYNPADFDFA